METSNLNHPSKFPKRTLLFIFILAIGLILRIYHLNFQSLWFDELHSLNGSEPSRSLSSVVGYAKYDQPPAYFILLHYWSILFAHDEFYARLLSVITGLAGILVIYILGKEIKSKETGLIAAFITAINYFHILYSQEARFYSLLFLASGLSYLFFIRAIKGEKIPDFIFYCVFTTLALYTHYYGLVLFASQGIIFLYIAFKFKHSTPFIIKSVVAALVTILLFTPWIPQVLSDNKISEFWIEQVKPWFVFSYYFSYFKEVISAAIGAFAIVLFIRSTLKSFPGFQINEKMTYIIMASWVFLGFFIPLLYSLIKMPMLLPRYTIIVLPAFFIMIGIGFEEIKKERLKVALLGIIFLSSIINLFFVSGYYSTIKKEQWREISTEVTKVDCEKCIYISYYHWYFNYYFNKLSPKQVIHVDDVPLEQLNQYDSIWFLAGHIAVEEFTAPEILTKNFTEAEEIIGKNALAKLYIKNDIFLNQKRRLIRRKTYDE